MPKARRGFLAVKLQQVGLQILDDGLEQRIVGIHCQRDFQRAPRTRCRVRGRRPARRSAATAGRTRSRPCRRRRRARHRGPPEWKGPDFNCQRHGLGDFGFHRLAPFYNPGGLCLAPDLWLLQRIGGFNCRRSAGEPDWAPAEARTCAGESDLAAKRDMTFVAARRRHLLCRSHETRPPMATPEATQQRSARTSHIVRVRWLDGLNGSSETVTSCRFATAKATMTIASGTESTTATILRNMLAAIGGLGQPGVMRLSRSRISLPVLKNGTHF